MSGPGADPRAFQHKKGAWGSEVAAAGLPLDDFLEEELLRFRLMMDRIGPCGDASASHATAGGWRFADVGSVRCGDVNETLLLIGAEERDIGAEALGR